MNILVSYNWLKEYLKTGISPEEFASRVSLCGPSVERIYRKESELEKIVIGQILNVAKHPNADKLRLVEVDIGKNITVVCGGSNLRDGMKVAVALPGAKVRWHGEGELVELEPTEIRGVKSEGMICAAEEIGLGPEFPKKEEREILDLSDLDAKPGAPLSSALNLEDAVFDIEVTTNRPDAMCILGIAREAGAILKAPFLPPDIPSVKKITDGGDILNVKNEEPELCRRYQAVVIEGVKVKESPWWLKQKLVSAGAHPINNIVDITNFVLLEMGQPLHAFDYKKLEDGKIIIRKAKKGEEIKALDGLNYKLSDEMLVIADGKKPVAVAGIMGGEETGVGGGTQTIVLEAANFDCVSVRRTSRALNLRSGSSNLFEKGLPPEATSAALARAANLVIELAGGSIASGIFDEKTKFARPEAIVLPLEKAEKVMGVKLEAEEIADILTRLGFETAVRGAEIKAKPPYWREGDMEIAEDLIEEAARIYGYHRLPSILPEGKLPGLAPEKIFFWERAAKNFCAGLGYDEIFSYSMAGEKTMQIMGEKNAVKIANPLTSDLEYMRVCLLPGLLQAAADNEKNFRQAKIFELGRVYLPEGKAELPEEAEHLAGLCWGGENLFYEAKSAAFGILDKFGIADFKTEKSDDKNFHPARAMDIYLDKNYIGSFGEIHPAVSGKFGLDSRAGFFYFYFSELIKAANPRKSYRPSPEFPGIKRDISFMIDKKIEYEKIKQAAESADALVAEVSPFDIYEGKGVPADKKSMALHILFQSANRTLAASEAEVAMEKIAKALKEKFHASVRM